MQIYYRVTPDKFIEMTMYNDPDENLGTALLLNVQDANKLLNAVQNAIDELKKVP